MALFLDFFGFLSVVLRSLQLTAASLTIGGIGFVLLVARPALAPDHAGNGAALARMFGLIRIGAGCLAAIAAASTAVDVAVLIGGVGVTFISAITAPFALATALMSLTAIVIAANAHDAVGAGRERLLGLAAVVLLGCAVATTHAVARLDFRWSMIGVSALHQAGAALWIGGIPFFLIALARAAESAKARLAQRFSNLCVIAVGMIATTALAKGLIYIGSAQAFYGTQYGVMSATKLVLFVALLLLGAANFLAVRRLAQVPALRERVRRHAEIEIFLGVTVLFVAASLTSLPPAVDLTNDRVAWREIVERVLIPRAPHLESPDHASLAIPAEQARLNRLAAERREHAPQAYVPGSGIIVPDTAADIAWSEYNHNWSGIFVLAIGLIALLAQAGVGPARHWPLLFIALGAFLLIRSDPEGWPLGDISFLAGMRDPEVLQHRLAMLVCTVFGIFEWRVRVGELRNTGAVYVFPGANIAGAILLLTHSHMLVNVKEAFLVELSHIALALFALVAGCARWLEIRGEPAVQRVMAWVWPLCFIALGSVLILYRES